MPTLIQSEVAKGKIAQPVPDASGDVVAFRATVDLTANPTANDIFEVLGLPPSCRVVDIIVDSDDMDTNVSPTLAFDVGIMSGTYGDNDSARTVGAEFFAASAVAQTGVETARSLLKSASRTAINANSRGVGLKCTTTAATFAAGTIGITLFYVAAD